MHPEKSTSDNVDTVDGWKFRLRVQANWTREWRKGIYDTLGIRWKKRILDAGCGTGEVTGELSGLTFGKVVAVDNDAKMLGAARALLQNNKVSFMKCDISHLPFGDGTFDLALCNLVLMWVREPERAVSELARVVKKGGYVAATLEPDYGGRIDFPDMPFADAIVRDIRSKGGDPFVGRKLKGWFRRAGLDVQVGILSSIWDDAAMLANFDDDWKMNVKVFRDSGFSDDEIASFMRKEKSAIAEGVRVSFFPCFCAIGKKA